MLEGREWANAKLYWRIGKCGEWLRESQCEEWMRVSLANLIMQINSHVSLSLGGEE
jgi:hypothetical protein